MGSKDLIGANVSDRDAPTSDAAATVAPARPPRSASSDEPFPTVPGYEIVARLGAGGMGTVWRAVQLGTRRPVALKLLGHRMFPSTGSRLRFEREVELTARLQHPNIARVYDSGVDEGHYYYAMELFDGARELDRYVSGQRLARRAVLELMRTVCRAVAHAHERGVIHRDLKPSNILVTADGQPHVLDFGLAKLLEPEDGGGGGGDHLALTREGDVAGTPAYMSPEQAAGRVRDLDTRTDVYSLGVILYQLVTGQPPHDRSGTQFEVMRRILEEEPRSPRSVTRTVDKELDTLLMKALARAPGDRYATAGDLARDLDNYLRGDPLAARPPTLGYFVRRRVHKHRAKLAGAAAVVGPLLLGSAAWGAYKYRQVVSVPVNTDPPGAYVFVNGEEHSCGTPCFAFLGPGTHRITVKHPGAYLPATRVVEVAWGKARFASAEPIAMTPNYQTVAFSSLPAGAAFELVDRATGRLAVRGVTPFETPVPVGKYRARFVKAGYVDDAADLAIDVAGSTAGRVVQRELRPAGTPLD